MPPRVPPPVDRAALERAALAYLERFAASAAQVRQVLLRRVERAARAGAADRATATRLVEAVVGELVRRRLIDDRLFAEARARTLHRQGRPKVAIARALAQRGVARDDIAAALEALSELTPNMDLAAAVALVRRRRLGPFRTAAERATRRHKDLAVLARAGFDLRTARRVVDAADPAALEALLGEES